MCCEEISDEDARENLKVLTAQHDTCNMHNPTAVCSDENMLFGEIYLKMLNQ